MNILFVCENDWTVSVIFDLHLLAEGLCRLGHKVWAIDYRPQHPFFRIVRGVTIPRTSYVYPEASIDVYRPGFINVSGWLALGTAWVTHYRSVSRLITEHGIHVVVLYSVLRNGLATVAAAKRHHVPLVFRLVDKHRVIIAERGEAPKRLLSWMEPLVCKAADRVVALTPTYVEYARSMGIVDDKLRLLRFPVETSIFKPQPVPVEFRRKWGITEADRVIVFMGSFYKFGGMDSLLTTFRMVLAREPNAKLLLVGDGSLRHEIENACKVGGLDQRVVITGYQPWLTMPLFLNMADVCVNVMPNTPEAHDIFSAKIVQYLACGRPTVATRTSGLTSSLCGEDVGVVYTDGAEEMADAIMRLLGNGTAREKLGRSGIEHVKAHYDAQLIVKQFDGMLGESVAAHRRGKYGRVLVASD
ncbi:MAG: glycosyltransferase [Chloroflexi bacterium]|nr:glycosyltransferase [Chloroflexota bacterium]